MADQTAIREPDWLHRLAFVGAELSAPVRGFLDFVGRRTIGAREIDDQSLGRDLDELIAVAELLQPPAELVAELRLADHAKTVLALEGLRPSEGVLEDLGQPRLGHRPRLVRLDRGRVALGESLRQLVRELLDVLADDGRQYSHDTSILLILDAQAEA